MTAEEERLLNGCLAGDPKAQEQLFNRYSGKMMGVCYRYALTLPEAEDMLQEGFVKVFRQLLDFRREGSLEGWIRRIIVNTACDHYKRERRNGEKVDLDFALELGTEQYSPLENKEQLMILKQLPHEYQVIINLYVIEGYSHCEIGEMLNIAESSSRARLTRARTCFRELLNKAAKPCKSYVQRG